MEYFLGNEIDSNVRSAIIDTKNLIVPVICVYEVYKKMQTERNSSFANVLVEVMKKGEIVDTTCYIAMLAATFSKTHKLPMADSIIYATAKTKNAVVWTQDRHFENLDFVNYLPKNGLVKDALS
jgi:PIN domain nuclease of toxin-antitoxin system